MDGYEGNLRVLSVHLSQEISDRCLADSICRHGSWQLVRKSNAADQRCRNKEPRIGGCAQERLYCLEEEDGSKGISLKNTSQRELVYVITHLQCPAVSLMLD